MVKENGKRSLSEIAGDSIMPGLGSQEGWHMDQEKRQTKALEKIAKGYKDRRIVQEVALRESSVPDKKIYDLPSAYVPNEVVKGFSNIVDAQYGTTDAVRQSAEVIYGGLMNVESRVGDVVNAAYSIDGHVQEGNILLAEGNDLTRETNRKLDVVNDNLETIDETIYVQTEKIHDSMHGISSDRKSLSEIRSITEMEEVEMISMALKGVLDRKTSQEYFSYFSSFSSRKREVISQVVEYNTDFQKGLYNEIYRLRKIMWDKKDEKEKGVLFQKISRIENQITEEKEFIHELSCAMKAPIQVDSLRLLARHGKLDRFAQDELGENIREVRTDTYGMNQSMREMLEIMDKHFLDIAGVEENQRTQIEKQEISNNLQKGIKDAVVLQNQQQKESLSNQENQIYLQEEQNQLQRSVLFVAENMIGNQNILITQNNEFLKKTDIQTDLQTGMLLELGYLNDKVSEGFLRVSGHMENMNKILEIVAWTNVRVIETLRDIKEGLENQVKNWSHHRFEEHLKQALDLVAEGAFEMAKDSIKMAQQKDNSDPRSYFVEGISSLYLGDVEGAEKAFIKAEHTSGVIKRKGGKQEEVDDIVSKINTYLGRMYFKLSERAEKGMEEKIEKAIECAQKAYKVQKGAATGVDLARYLTIDGHLDEAYKVIKDTFKEFPEIIDVLLNDEDFAPYVAQVKKNNWKYLNDLRLKLLKRFTK